ncbi:ATP-dependent nuclease [Micromonospora echinofusca]|uniref:AAA family ATPase n=1 Tax=Micromonospora echinofusca TaxID=47858 RepID=A0ABS3VX48_MICEH|nr:AAA family ATPase [Micromonospora echinofusca]MBO4209110.1 AAA family ATPase [Micromonospora echinofusca]
MINGDANLSIAIGALKLKTGTEIALPDRGITVIVGGNNVGKSSLLSEMAALLARNGNDEKLATNVVESVSLVKSSSEAELISWLSVQGYAKPNGYFALPGHSPGVPEGHVRRQWRQDVLGYIAQFLIYRSEAVGRVNFAGGVSRREDISHPPTHPMHYLEDDPELLRQFNDICLRIFRMPLTLDRLSNTVSLRMGKVSTPAPPVDSVTREYRDALANLPLLAQQGDGVRSLLGMLLTIVPSAYPIVLIDEPEAFLHPPQAFELGRVLGEVAARTRTQIVLATHDRNLVSGLLDGKHEISIVRLDRSGNETVASQLKSSDVRSLWSDSVLRYSNALEGLFHHLVVLAEGDDDCRFYRAALDALDEAESVRVPPSEVLFVPTGGKDGMSKIVQAFGPLGVRIVASPDLDILDDGSKLKKLVVQFGGDWRDFLDDYDRVTKPFRTPRPQARNRDIIDAVNAVLSPISDEIWDEPTAQAVRAQMRLSENPWKALKLYGMAAFRTGESRAAAERLLGRLDELGICVVREGELERFASHVEVRKGPAWVSAAIGSGAHASVTAKDHMRRIIGNRD